ncbi:hypothetical protein V2J09_011711 [Rumex salicifolius]
MLRHRESNAFVRVLNLLSLFWRLDSFIHRLPSIHPVPFLHQLANIEFPACIFSRFFIIGMKSTGAMNWVKRKNYLYNVTFGLYMLDWWERYLFNTLILVLMWFILYNTSKQATEFGKRYLW